MSLEYAFSNPDTLETFLESDDGLNFIEQYITNTYEVDAINGSIQDIPYWIECIILDDGTIIHDTQNYVCRYVDTGTIWKVDPPTGYKLLQSIGLNEFEFECNSGELYYHNNGYGHIQVLEKV